MGEIHGYGAPHWRGTCYLCTRSPCLLLIVCTWWSSNKKLYGHKSWGPNFWGPCVLSQLHRPHGSGRWTCPNGPCSFWKSEKQSSCVLITPITGKDIHCVPSLLVNSGRLAKLPFLWRYISLTDDFPTWYANIALIGSCKPNPQIQTGWYKTSPVMAGLGFTQGHWSRSCYRTGWRRWVLSGAMGWHIGPLQRSITH